MFTLSSILNSRERKQPYLPPLGEGQDRKQEHFESQE